MKYSAFDFLSVGLMFMYYTLHTQNNIGKAITISLDLFMKSWFVAMARQIIIGPQIIIIVNNYFCLCNIDSHWGEM